MSGRVLPTITHVGAQALYAVNGGSAEFTALSVSSINGGSQSTLQVLGTTTFNSNVTVLPDQNAPYGNYMLKAGANYFNITQAPPANQAILQARSVNPDGSISTSLTMVCQGSGASLTYGTAALGANGVIAFQDSAGMQLSNVSSLSYGATAIPVDALISSCQGFFGL